MTQDRFAGVKAKMIIVFGKSRNQIIIQKRFFSCLGIVSLILFDIINIHLQI